MAYITGAILIDAPASALNNAGQERGARTDNIIVVKRIRTPDGGVLPYVSAQAVRYWIRTTLEQESLQPVLAGGAASGGSGWVAAKVFREGKIAYTHANPITNWDDDLFGYMRAPSKKEAAKDPNATPLEEGREITRVSPFRVSTLLSTGPAAVVQDYGTMTRQNGHPVPYEHEFYRCHLLGLFSIDLTSAGTFYDTERVGFKNLDTHRRSEAEKVCQKLTVRGQTAFRLPLSERQTRVATLVRSLGRLNGGAKLALHYTDVSPAAVFAGVTKHGNHPFARIFHSSRTHQTELHVEALNEALRVFEKDFVSKIHVGWATGFLDEHRARLPQHPNLLPTNHPSEAFEALAKDVEQSENGCWFD